MTERFLGMDLLAIVGGRGMLARAVKDNMPQGWRLFELNRPEFDITDRNKILQTLQDARPQCIVNCAAYTQVDACETNREQATQVNGQGPGFLAEGAREVGATLVHVSTDYVFDGADSTPADSTPYREEDRTNPQSVYGQSKLMGERAIQACCLEKYFIVRTSWLYGPGEGNFVETIARLAAEREELRIVADQIGTPTYAGDLAAAIFALLETKDYGIYHFSNRGECSWHEFAQEIVRLLKCSGEAVKTRRVLPITTAEYLLPAKRPAYSVLSTKKYQKITGRDVPSWQDGLKRYISERGAC